MQVALHNKGFLVSTLDDIKDTTASILEFPSKEIQGKCKGNLQ